MIYDTFIFYNELDMLDLRLHILNDVVDRFVLVEAGETHSGKPKPAYFAENRERFAPFLDKIEYVYVSSLTAIAGEHSWHREKMHRASIALGLQNAHPLDWVIVSDLDEIPHPDRVRDLQRIGGDGVKFELDFYYYNFNCRVKQGWAIGAARWGRERNPNRIRTQEGITTVTLHGGWHFSYFMSPEQVADKLDAFMHHSDVAANVPRDPAWLGAQMSAGADIYGRGLPIEYVPLSDTLPAYVLANIDTYRHWFAQEAKA